MLIGSIVLAVFILIVVITAVALRRVVPTNEVHIVQSSKESKSYGNKTGDSDGNDLRNGNTYYEIPSWVPRFGVLVSKYPVSVFSETLDEYEAFDQGKLPFKIDVMAFFKIDNSQIAAQSVSSFEELRKQLQGVLQGSIRSILATSTIESIMQDRAKFGAAFTKEVDDNLMSWGVKTVKSVELMNIMDTDNSNVIKNIMSKKISQIEMESRIEVAANNKTASLAEIDARRETDVQKQDAEQQVGLRTAQKDQEVGIATEKSNQMVKEQQKVTKQKEMEILQVQEVQTAEISKKVKIVEAEQSKETSIINATADSQALGIQVEAEKNQMIVKAIGESESAAKTAEGAFQAEKFKAQGIEAVGLAEAAADKAKQMAQIEPQITLADKIGSNDAYQKYLLAQEQIAANARVGMEQAKALEKAEIKIIANSGNVNTGLSKVTDVFSSKGGSQLAGMLEGLMQTDAGKGLVEKFIGNSAAKSADSEVA